MGIERLKEFWPEWRVLEPLGSGAFGKVYKAVNEEAGFPVYSAIKVLSIPSTEAELDALRSEGMSIAESKTYFKGIAQDFVNEIKLMNTLRGSSNIVSVEGFKIIEKTSGIGWDIFIRMELLTSFKEYLSDRMPTEEEVVRLGIDISSALEICSQKNIIHRDIKPANIFINGFGSFKLGDFGIAKELEKTTGAVSSKGTFSYMAPEVAHGERYDATVDIYSLGLVLYTLLNNNRQPLTDPFASSISYNDRKKAIDLRLSGTALPPPCNASPTLANIILAACSYESKKRFSNPTAFKNALMSYRNSVYGEDSGNTFFTAEKTVQLNREDIQTDTSDPSFDYTAIENMSSKDDMVKGDDIPVDSLMYRKYRETNEDPAKTKKRSFILIILLLLILLTVLGVTVYMIIMPSENTHGNLVTDTESIQTPDPENNSGPVDKENVQSDVAAGDIIRLGSYEQDMNASNGAESIDWQVLCVEGDKALVVSRYALANMPYHEEKLEISWENCSLRAWLNGDFYNNAFTEEEGELIINTSLENSDNPEYKTEGGNDTYDKLFLLSIEEANEYFATNGKRKSFGTDAVTQYEEEYNLEGSVWWWLRSPGDESAFAANVGPDGSIYTKGASVSFMLCAVRPAMWISANDVNIVNEGDTPSFSIGDELLVGSYEQDNDLSNGSEAICWEILDIQDNKALVISKYALDCVPYNNEYEDVTWATSDLRAWLNNDFYDTAFDENLKYGIIQTKCINADNSEFNTEGGADTEDRIFLLSIEDIEKYYSSKEAMICVPTAYAEAQGVYVNDSENGKSCWWWLRSPGYHSKGASFVFSEGGIGNDGDNVSNDHGAVRPAMWITI